MEHTQLTVTGPKGVEKVIGWPDGLDEVIARNAAGDPFRIGELTGEAHPCWKR